MINIVFYIIILLGLTCHLSWKFIKFIYHFIESICCLSLKLIESTVDKIFKSTTDYWNI